MPPSTPLLGQGPSYTPMDSISSRGPGRSQHYRNARSGSAPLLNDQSLSEKYTVSSDPAFWGAYEGRPEPDDWIHNPNPTRDRKDSHGGTMFTRRGLLNIGCMLLLILALVMLFLGYPVTTYLRRNKWSTRGAYNLGGVNGTGQIPLYGNNFGLIDKDTPTSEHTRTAVDGSVYQLVFSDEFNEEGRTFYPGDDPYWEAVNLHYWQTNNLEWYDPRQITTEGGKLAIRLDERPSHNLNYEGGMMSTWNKFCFSGGILTASISLPGEPTVWGLWPASWSMGNLGRAGYGASLEGMWPYSYDACDVGTVANQSLNGFPAEVADNMVGDPYYEGVLSYLPGQRLSRCTCPDESHPGPIDKRTGEFVGRSAPEIDVFEAQVDQSTLTGHVSQSAQWAPFNANYTWTNTSSTYALYEGTYLNTFQGGVFQQATSGIATTNQNCYSGVYPTPDASCYSEYSFRYQTGDKGYIEWYTNGTMSWRLEATGVGLDIVAQIAERKIPYEPMYLILNLGLSENFGAVDYEGLMFPAIMYVDWVRVYQPADAINIGCDPKKYPTSDYINQYIEAYTNPNLTTWVDDYGQTMPRNRYALGGSC